MNMDEWFRKKIDQLWFGHGVAYLLSSISAILLTTLLMLPIPAVATTGNDAQLVAEPVVLEVFVRETCPHCADAKAFLPAFAAQRPWLQIVYRSVSANAAARDDLMRHSRRAGVWPPGVPTFVIDNQVLVGFESAEITGPELAAWVDGQQTHHNTNVETRLFGTVSVSNMGLPLFTLVMGLLDGFNPCAMWVLLFLLSMLVHLQNRKRMALIAGIFLLVSGAVYYAFMATWLNIFLLVGLSATVRLALGVLALIIGFINVKDFVALGKGISLSIPESARPGLYARMRMILRADTLLPSLFAVAVLAVVVNFIEALCTAGLPAIYTAVLAQHDLSPAAHYAYLGLYILGYMADDTLMVATAVMALSSRKLTENAGRWLKLMSGTVMLLLGAIIILRPDWLL
jgi:glutaredoxin